MKSYESFFSFKAILAFLIFAGVMTSCDDYMLGNYVNNTQNSSGTTDKEEITEGGQDGGDESGEGSGEEEKEEPEDIEGMKVLINLSSNGTANCYNIIGAGYYQFKAVKGNSNDSVGTIDSVEVLWESFGTEVAPKVGQLIESVSYEDGYVKFLTPYMSSQGNAVIAAKDASGKILWSWHIWLAPKPKEEKYFNNAGTMMDRNLGALSAEPGDIRSLGLLYQWGRKDPFLGSSKYYEEEMANSTITWPAHVSSKQETGTIEYTIANPTTLITFNSLNYDWYYTGSDAVENERWTTSRKTKSIYDPCPVGWRVPDGGTRGVWAKALGTTLCFKDCVYDKEAISLSGILGSGAAIWYPCPGYISHEGILRGAGTDGEYWSASTSPEGFPASASCFEVYFSPYVYTSSASSRSSGCSVRCIKE